MMAMRLVGARARLTRSCACANGYPMDFWSPGELTVRLQKGKTDDTPTHLSWFLTQLHLNHYWAVNNLNIKVLSSLKLNLAMHTTVVVKEISLCIQLYCGHRCIHNKHSIIRVGLPYCGAICVKVCRPYN